MTMPHITKDLDTESIGWVHQPGSEPHTFTFIALDSEQALKAGEYIIYEAKETGQQFDIICRITGRVSIRPYPPTFAIDPGVSPDDVAETLGYQANQAERYALTATILGYYDKQIGSFVNPRLPPKAGTPVRLASAHTLTNTLSTKSPATIGSAHLGSLLSRKPGQVPLAIDVAAIASTHLAVIASTGAGKSYLAAVLTEEMMMPHNRAAMLIIDPHGEYHTLREMIEEDAFATRDYQPQVQVIDDLRLQPGQLTFSDLTYLLPNLSERMEYLLRKAFYSVRQASFDQHGNPEQWRRSDLITTLEQLGGLRNKGESTSTRRDASTAEALIWRLESVLGRSNIFVEKAPMTLSNLIRPGLLTILDVQELNDKGQTVLVAALLRQLLAARQRTVKGTVKSGGMYLPYPLFVLLEEAHRFAPAHESLVTSHILKQILAEGRKFGIGVGLVSQRPGKMDADVLSQCNSQFLLRIVNPLDQAKVAESVETVGRELIQELPTLTRGQVIVAGSTVNTPVLLRVRGRLTSHGGASLDAPKHWQDYFDE